MKNIDVHLHPTYECNLACIHCYNSSSLDYAGPRLSASRTIDIVRFLSSTYDCDMHLEGGELFLLPDILQALRNLPREALANMTVTTNGTIRVKDPGILETLRSVGRLRVSVEGHLETHQRSIRGTTLKQVLGSAAFYRDAGARVALRMTLTSINGGALVQESLPFLGAAGFSRLQVYEYQAVGRGAENVNLGWDRPIGSLLDQLILFEPENAMHLSLMFPAHRIPEVEAHGAALSGAGWSVVYPIVRPSLSIRPDGMVYACPWADSGSTPTAMLAIGMNSIAELIETGAFDHACDHCTSVILRREWWGDHASHE